jgi:FlaA1/EpsC-like NDP-sugar epimerase
MKDFKLKGKTIFIAGGSGTLGYELTKQLIDLNPREIRIFSRGEVAQVLMKKDFNVKTLKFIIGDIRDYSALMYNMKGSDVVFNLAALKHVGICEKQPQEAVRTNIDGMVNLIHASIALKVRKFVFMSSDKAIYSSSLYGMTKGVGERLTIQANALTEETDFICVRSGNIMGSSGSVVPLFIDMVNSKNKITVTDGSMTRYFLSVKEIAEVNIKAVSCGAGGEIFVPSMPSFYIKDLAKIILEHYSNGGLIEEVGMRPGEKKHELLISVHESSFTRKLDNGVFVIIPSIDVSRSYKYLDGCKFPYFDQLSSDESVHTSGLLEKMLFENNFIK